MSEEFNWELFSWFVVMLLILVLLFCAGCELPAPSHHDLPQPSFIWADPLMWMPGQIILQKE